MSLIAQFSDPIRKAMDRARTALSDSPEFIASLEGYWRRVIPDTAPADALACSEDVWRWIAMCRRPRPERFQEDIQIIANAADVDGGKLQHFIVTALTVERFRNAPPEAQQAPMDLLAARQRHDDAEQ